MEGPEGGPFCCVVVREVALHVRSMRKTYVANKEKIERKWLHVDASGKVLGRLAAHIATVLMGKHRPTYTPHVDTGDFVVVTNAASIRVTGRKMQQKEYQQYSHYPGGLRRTPLSRMMAKKPAEVLRLAVRRMLPKGALGNQMLKKLKVYAGSEHPHVAQQPEEMALPKVGKRVR